MTTPRLRLTALPSLAREDARGYDRNAVVVAALGVWLFLVLLGLVLTFS